jgi:hypothetical protein
VPFTNTIRVGICDKGGVSIMDKVEKIIKLLSLPLALPEEAFILGGRPRRLPDIDLIINNLPQELHVYLDLEATVLHSGRGGQSTFLLTLLDASYLRIRIKNRFIVELSRTHLRASGMKTIH